MSARRHWHTLFSAKTVCSRQRRNQKLQPNTTYIHKHTHTPIYGYERVREQSQETKQYKLHIYFQINLACMCMYIHFIYYYIYTYIYIYTRILVYVRLCVFTSAWLSVARKANSYLAQSAHPRLLQQLSCPINPLTDCRSTFCLHIFYNTT